MTAPRSILAVGLAVTCAYLLVPPTLANWLYELLLLGTVLAMLDRARREQSLLGGPGCSSPAASPAGSSPMW